VSRCATVEFHPASNTVRPGGILMVPGTTGQPLARVPIAFATIQIAAGSVETAAAASTS
jgi:hypothetical protein